MEVDDVTEPTPGHERLGELCRRMMAAPPGPTPDARLRRLVEHVLAEVRSGRPPGELEDFFDEVEELLLATGHSAGLGSYRTAPGSYQQLPGAGRGHSALHVLACPLGRCARVEAPTSDYARPSNRERQDRPHCLVFDQPLRKITLRP
ncbi:hypothetical protein [Kitasatospora sp. NPDC015120]|uniref:hypothetical protein n=1 Tax=Kitasatospora sp. NPDC015120 TaxID=3364023 RepID=UPI0036F4979A